MTVEDPFVRAARRADLRARVVTAMIGFILLAIMFAVLLSGAPCHG